MLNYEKLVSYFGPYKSSNGKVKELNDAENEAVVELYNNSRIYPSSEKITLRDEFWKDLPSGLDGFILYFAQSSRESIDYFILFNAKDSIILIASSSPKQNTHEWSCVIRYCSKEGRSVAMNYLKPYLISGESSNELNIWIVRQGFELEIVPHKISKPTIDIPKNYGSSFEVINHKIIQDLETDMRGLYIFSGEPGTGKTHYLQYLIGKISRRFIYFSPKLLNIGLDSPEVISLLSNFPNSVLLVEEGEAFITNRADDVNSKVSSLLNCSDGILGKVINCSIILTHNQSLDAKNIDPAILRKGRLKIYHQFNKLSPEDANIKLADLGVETRTKNPMSLAEIFNFQSTNNTENIITPRTIGFK